MALTTDSAVAGLGALAARLWTAAEHESATDLRLTAQAVARDLDKFRALLVSPNLDGHAVSDSSVVNSPTAALQCAATLSGHRDYVCCVAVLGETILVTGSEDCTLRIWDRESLQCVRTFNGHSDAVTCVSLCSDKFMCSGSKDKSVKIWDTDSGECLATGRLHTKAVQDLAVLTPFSFVSASFDGKLRVWDVDERMGPDPANDSALHAGLKFEGHRGAVWCVAARGPGEVVSGGDDGKLRVWDVAAGSCLATLEGHKRCVCAVLVLGGDRLVSGSKDNTVRIWETSGWTCTSTLTGHEAYVRGLAVLGTDGPLVSASSDRTLRLWDLSTGQSRGLVQAHADSVVGLATISENTLVSCSDDKMAKLWVFAPET